MLTGLWITRATLSTIAEAMMPLLSRPLAWALATLFCGLVYVAGFAWSPSSYGVVLREIGVLDAGPDVGQPRPIRSDEWSVVTPLTQAAVRNGFKRTNHSSLYEEDLRINYGIPLLDWGLLFKPTLWGFFVLDPASAYSLHWFAVMAMFLIGHSLLFARIGMAPAVAGFLSVALYFTGFAQFWWNEKGPVLAFFPWVVLVLLSRRLPKHWQLLLFYWLSASWLITNLYPPVQVSLAFVGALLVLGWQPVWRQPRNLVAAAVTAGLSAATVAVYLKDYLLATAATVYPGSRSAVGGAVPWKEALSYLFPFSTFDGRYESVIGNNICEVGTGATALTLLIGCFLNYRGVKSTWRRATPTQQFQGWLLGGGVILMVAWMLVPLPSWVGYPLLWNHAPGERMEYAFGVLVAIALALAAQTVGLTWSRRRLLLFVSLVLVGWVTLKLPATKGVYALNDLLVLVAVLPALWAWRRGHLEGTAALVGASALGGLIALWGFNPLQSARPIFAEHDTPMLRELAQQQRANGGVLAQGGLFGAVQNGLGFRSVAHVTAVPALAFWRKQYPEMPEQEFLEVFNRYSHIVLAEGDRPRVLFPDRIAIPAVKFLPDHVMLPTNPPRSERGLLGVPVLLFEGMEARGAMILPRAGRLLSVAPAVGNGQGTSNGRLVARVCHGSECLETSRDLRESVDNTYFELSLPSSLTLSVGDRLDFSMKLEGASTPVALWAYPAPSDSLALAMLVEGRPAERWLPRLDLRFEREAIQ